jgi:general secretion pathway protein K
VQLRETSPFKQGEVRRYLPANAVAQGQGYDLDATSNYFEVRARLRLDKLIVEERSMLTRSNTTVTVVQRERGPVDSTALSQAALGQR